MHRPRNLIIFYVPAGATLFMGPTAIIPHSHLMSVDGGDWACLEDPTDLTELWAGAVEHKLTAPAHTGVAVLLHPAMFHRGTSRLAVISAEHPFRAMFKFIFSSTRTPTTPSWDAASPAADWSAVGIPSGMEGACESLWSWFGGDPTAAPNVPSVLDSVVDLGARLMAEHAHGDELGRINASYALAKIAASDQRDSARALELLLAAITHETNEGARRVAVPGLAAAGDAAVPSLVAMLARIDAKGCDETTLRTVAYGADALGEAAESQHTWMPALQVLAKKELALEAAVAAGHFGSLQGDVNANPNTAISPSGSAGCVLAAVEHITQRAIVAGDAEACELASGILLQALACDHTIACAAAAAVASVAIADRRLVHVETWSKLQSKVMEVAGSGLRYMERAVASEALKRLIAPRAETALARAQRRVVQSVLEAEWAAPEDDPRQYHEDGRVNGLSVPRPDERGAASALFALRNVG